MDIKKFMYMQISNGEILGYFDADINPDIPDGCLRITRAQWQANLDMGATHYIDGTPRVMARDSDIALEPIIFRKWRDLELSNTDRYLLSDYPISPEDKAEILTYRQALRDCPISGVKPVKPDFLNRKRGE